MKNLILIIVGPVIFWGLLGCAAPSMYYWGGYSSALYAYKKNATESAREGYKKSLEDIIAVSPQRNLRVPPGVYCEYGYILAKEGHSGEAVKYFNLEKTTYPESGYFIDKLIARMSSKADASPIRKE